MATTGITIDVGDALTNQSNNSPTEMNTKFTTLASSIETALGNTTDGYRSATNDSGGALAAGDIVYPSGYDSTNSRIKFKKAVSALTSVTTFYGKYIIVTGGADQAVVYAVERLVRSTLNTLGLTAGKEVYLSTTAGGWTGTMPAYPYRVQCVGTILEVSATVGRIEFFLPGTIVPVGAADDI